MKPIEHGDSIEIRNAFGVWLRAEARSGVESTHCDGRKVHDFPVVWAALVEPNGLAEPIPWPATDVRPWEPAEPTSSPVVCTTLWAKWCPHCGDCTCPSASFGTITPNGCPLHGSTSFHIGPVLRHQHAAGGAGIDPDPIRPVDNTVSLDDDVNEPWEPRLNYEQGNGDDRG